MNKKKFGIILPITLLAYFLILMDNSIIFTSSIQIAKSLTLSSSELSWVSSAYLVLIHLALEGSYYLAVAYRIYGGKNEYS